MNEERKQPKPELPEIKNYDGPPCQNCGAIMQQTGHCYTCPECGTTSGCMSIATTCNLCLDNEHQYVCDCGHPHSEHIFAGGCTAKLANNKYCDCTCYSQKKLVKNVS